MFDDRAVLSAVDDAIGEKLVAIGEYVTEQVARRAPKDSWELVKSITYRVDRMDRKVVIIVGAFYSAYIEFGFRHRIGKKTRRRRGRKTYGRLTREQIAAGQFKEVPPRPFLRPAVYESLPQIIEILEGAMDEAVESVAA